MKKLTFAILCMAVSFYGCGPGGGRAEKKVADADASAQDGANTPAPRIKKLNIDISEQKRLQEASDNGGQAWRKEAADAAHAALIAESVNVRVSDCKVVKEGPEDCVVKATVRENDFTVRLKRLVKPGGIWTVTEIKVDGPELTIGGGQGVHLHGGQEHYGHEHAAQDSAPSQTSHSASHDHAGH